VGPVGCTNIFKNLLRMRPVPSPQHLAPDRPLPPSILRPRKSMEKGLSTRLALNDAAMKKRVALTVVGPVSQGLTGDAFRGCPWKNVREAFHHVPGAPPVRKRVGRRLGAEVKRLPKGCMPSTFRATDFQVVETPHRQPNT